MDPTSNTLLHAISNQIASREEIQGAYIVIDQASEDGYVCTSFDTLLSLLILVDDISRGSGKRVVVNYAGSFGILAHVVGAYAWVSGYYLSQRRLKLSDYDDKKGLAMPRYFSPLLAGDVGLEDDAAKMYRRGFGQRVFIETDASRNLVAALARGASPSNVPEWEYRKSNISSAAAHYNHVCNSLTAFLRPLGQEARIEWATAWLEGAVQLAIDLENAGIQRSTQTELVHQRVWLNAFSRWRETAGL
jgi:hypothetical protein